MPVHRLLAAVLLTLAACDEPPDPIAVVEVWGADGALTLSSVIDFGPVPLAIDSSPVVIEIRSAGTGTVTLTGDPPVQISDDSGLAFRVTQPAETVLGPGVSTSFEVRFRPREPGDIRAQLRVPTSVVSALGEPLVAAIALEGLGTTDGRPALKLLADNTPIQDQIEFGVVPVGETRTIPLAVENIGDAPLEFGSPTTTVEGPDAAHFKVLLSDTTPLAAGQSRGGTLTVTAPTCGPLEASLTLVSSAPTSPTLLSLHAHGAVSPSVVVGATDANALSGVPAALALSRLGTVSVIGNPTADTFNGEVAHFRDTGCAVTRVQGLTAGQANLGATQFGTLVDLDDTGEITLVTAIGHPEAWLYLTTPETAMTGPDQTVPAPGARLSIPGSIGPAVLSAAGQVALFGDTRADSGFHEHGGVEVFVSNDVWLDQDGPRELLVPGVPIETEALGQAVAISADERLIVAVAKRGSVGLSQDIQHDLAIHFYHRDETGRYGIASVTDPNRRTEQKRLLIENRSGSETRIAVSEDGTTVVVADVGANVSGTSTLYVFETGADGQIAQTATLSARGGGPSFRLRLGQRGDVLLTQSDANLAIDETQRPVNGWQVTTEVGRVWPLTAPVAALALSGDARVIGLLDDTGALTLLRR
ncbi:MAG: hypothetical protein ACI9MR_004273 [Myxococcota bacterium]|jgi:hypothetical protein